MQDRSCFGAQSMKQRKPWSSVANRPVASGYFSVAGQQIRRHYFKSNLSLRKLLLMNGPAKGYPPEKPGRSWSGKQHDWRRCSRASCLAFVVKICARQDRTLPEPQQAGENEQSTDKTAGLSVLVMKISTFRAGGWWQAHWNTRFVNSTGLFSAAIHSVQRCRVYFDH